VKTYLVTGASGFIGSRLANQLSDSGAKVIAFTRKDIDNPSIKQIFGDYANLDDLAQLKDLEIDVVIHLAGVTGDALEDDAMMVNVAGTSRFLRFMIDLGVKKFVTASSIAAVGCLTADFMPRSLPIKDDHPCDSANVYGLSKFFVEEISKYFSRLHQDVDFTLFRIGVVLAETAVAADEDRISKMWRPFCTLGCISVTDVVDAFQKVVQRSVESGVHIMNLVADKSYSTIPTIDALKLALGERADDLDLSFYKKSGNEHAGLYDLSAIRKFIEFEVSIDLQTMNKRS
jgi:UDP-glucose 4-epimerase